MNGKLCMAMAFLVAGPTKMLPLLMPLNTKHYVYTAVLMSLNHPPHHWKLEIPVTLLPRREPSQTESGSITIASLNVKGENSVNTWNKWKQITHCMKVKNITILCVLESHS